MADSLRLTAALQYASIGWRVIPLYGIVDYDDRWGCECRKGIACPSPGKHPRLGEWTKQATTEAGQIQQWWKDFPAANVGIATGAQSGVVVLDIDPKSGGRDSMRRIVEEFGRMEQGLIVETGSGGWHYYFQHPGGYQGNLQGSATTASPLGPGLDFRGDGGMVVAPPSIHASGASYKWIAEKFLPALPTWLKIKLAANHRAEPAPAAVYQPDAEGMIAEGQRHRTLIAWAGSLRNKGFGFAAIQAALSAENQTRFTVPKEQSEIDKIAKWICRFPAGEVPGQTYLFRAMPEGAAEPVSVPQGLVSVDDVAEELDQLFELGAQRGYSTGISALDELYSLQPGDLTMLLAAPSSGKTTFINTIAANTATEHGWKVAICSTENRVSYLMADLASLLVGQTYYGNFPEHRMPVEEKDWVRTFLRQHFRFIVPRSDTPLTFQWVCGEAAAWGANLLTIDPFGSLDVGADRSVNDSRAIRNILHGFLQPFLKETKMHCILSVHTTKLSMDDQGDIRMPNPYDATDSAGFYNAGDGFIALRRPASRGGTITEGEVQKVRDRFTGKMGKFDLVFDFRTSRYTSLRRQIVVEEPVPF